MTALFGKVGDSAMVKTANTAGKNRRATIKAQAERTAPAAVSGGSRISQKLIPHPL